MAAKPKDCPAAWAFKEAVLPVIDVRVNLGLDAAFVCHHAEFHIAPDTAAKQVCLDIKAQVIHHFVELLNRISVGQEDKIEYWRKLFPDMRVPGDKIPVGGIGHMD